MPTPEEKRIGIIAYLTFIGMFIAYFMNRETKSAYATKHIQMMFGLVILLFISQVTHAYIHIITADILWLASFILWIWCGVQAVMGKLPNVPYLSDAVQKWFLFLEP